MPEAGSLESLGRLEAPGFELALASVLLDAGDSARQCVERLRLSNDAAARVLAFIENHPKFGNVREMSASVLKRFLRMKDFDQQLELYRAAVCGDERYEYVLRLRGSMTDELLWPRRLLSGDDLKVLGVPTGPMIARILTALEDAQLEGRIGSTADAETFVKEAFSGESST